ncbi:hypothetical protein [Enterococcus mundtii]|uniref:DUF2187 domain-containing protein n=1 Tax=Enterococcus mundtii TaxID=53346 RepID=A0A242KUD6_ENTMU|nr:hypothetical protein [Enterococcus mundtii]OTP24856.1 hypothetical protein A5802_003011 [Enterococcus mundtii]
MEVKVKTLVTANDVSGNLVSGEVYKILVNTVIIKKGVEYFLIKKSTLIKKGYQFSDSVLDRRKF